MGHLDPRRSLEKLNFAPRVGVAYRFNDSFTVRSGYGLTWIEQAGITTPFTTPLFPFIQNVGQQSLDNINPAFVLSSGPSVRVTDPDPDSGLGQSVFAVERKQKSGYAQQWNLSFQKTFGGNWTTEIGYLGSKLTNLGVPDVNLQPTHCRTTGAWFDADPVGAESLLWTDSRNLVTWPADDFQAAVAATVSAFHDGRVLSQQCGSLDISLLADARGATIRRTA